jgi:DNA-binding CsgD family transcriptional regulator
LCREVGEPLTLICALHTLGLFAYTQGRYTEAYELFEQSLQVAKMSKRTDTSSVIAICLIGLGTVMAAQGQFDHAATQLGAAEALCDVAAGKTVAGMVDWLTTLLRTQLGYDQIVQTVQAHLGEEAFAAAWKRGTSMTMEELLEDSDPPLDRVREPLVAAQPEKQAGPSASSFAMGEPLAGGSSLSLTARESEVLHLLAQGLTSAQIARALVITPLTVNSHVRSIYSKLGISSRSAATRYAIEHQLA